MSRYNLREKLPSLSVPRPSLSDEARLRLAVYLPLLLAALVAVVGQTLLLSGAIIVVFMTLTENLVGVVAAAAMVAVGITSLLATYIWLVTETFK